jgi:hypothetical protein
MTKHDMKMWHDKQHHDMHEAHAIVHEHRMHMKHNASKHAYMPSDDDEYYGSRKMLL